MLPNEIPDQRGSHLLEAGTSSFFPHACSSSPVPDSLLSSVRVLPVESAGVCVALRPWKVASAFQRFPPEPSGGGLRAPPPAEHDSRRSCCLDISCCLIKMRDDNESHRRRSSIDLHLPPASRAQTPIHKHVPIKQSIRRSQIYSPRQCYVDALTADLPECEPA